MHGNTGIITVIEATPRGDRTIEYRIRLVYETDGDPVADADVTVSVDDGLPQPMTAAGDGDYTATVVFDTTGEHRVLFSSDDPTATLEHTERVTAAQPATTTTTTSAAVATTAPVARSETDERTTSQLVVLLVGAALMLAVAIAVIRRGRRVR